MPHYTLFIDESGSFGAEKRRESWIVGGLLTSMKFDEFETSIKNPVKKIQEKYGLPQSSHFHATEIREKYGNEGHIKVREVFSDLIDELDNIRGVKSYFISTINQTKISTNNAERNYRLMLLDLIIQAEKLIEQTGDDIKSFDLVIASRTIDNERQTDYTHINSQILHSLPSAIESDLVAYGRLYLLGDNLKVHIKNAKKKWGLIYADFLCNLTYNRRFPENQEILNNLEKDNKLISYQTYSSAELRRILSHEVNQNYSSAVFDCLRLLERKSNNDEEVQKILNRILKSALIDSGTTGVKVNFDAILEKIWRDRVYFKEYKKKADILLKLSSHIDNLHNSSKIKNLTEFQFKLKNLVLLCYNHIADTEQATKIVAEQEIVVNKLIADPSNYSMVLDFYARAIEVYVNNLQFVEAKAQANAYKQMIEDYFDSWQFINSDITKEDFLNSDITIRANSALIRTEILTLSDNSQQADEIFETLQTILKYAKNPQDISRLKSQQLILLCKLNKLDEAISLAKATFEQAKIQNIDVGFDYFFLLYVVNQKLLQHSDAVVIKYMKEVIENQADYKINSSKYPMPIIYRELSLFNYFINHKTEASNNLRLSNESTLKILNADSETTKFLKAINSLQEKVINDKKVNALDEVKNLNIKGTIITNDMNPKESLRLLRNFITS
ncbi:Uncharacterised protein [Moraxella atlantae]|uniref:DUF3800 domain-containing protein n=3 Tax=Faucicola atlantae TaxID=34059 RepID=A0A378Q1P2_9GAMM|nr:DUF3800 domain-containing protein [Moraxella atlantae]STY94314.1 Uncharacterised protein [Moraxella atlantae]